MLLGRDNTMSGSIPIVSHGTQVPTYFDLNTEHFYKPNVTIKINAVQTYNKGGHQVNDNKWENFEEWTTILRAEYKWNGTNRVLGEDSWPNAVEDAMTVISSSGSLSIKEIDPSTGFYVIAFSAQPPLNGNGYFLFGIEVSVKEGIVGDGYKQEYYFGANIYYQNHGDPGITPETIERELATGICLFYRNEGASPTEFTPTTTTIAIHHHENEGPFQACVLSSLQPLEIKTDWNDYIYYATGLPDGLNMKSDGTIEGKLAGYEERTNLTFTIYGVNKNYTTDRVS
jgi:hypothetical protein